MHILLKIVKSKLDKKHKELHFLTREEVFFEEVSQDVSNLRNKLTNSGSSTCIFTEDLIQTWRQIIERDIDYEQKTQVFKYKLSKLRQKHLENKKALDEKGPHKVYPIPHLLECSPEVLLKRIELIQMLGKINYGMYDNELGIEREQNTKDKNSKQKRIEALETRIQPIKERRALLLEIFEKLVDNQTTGNEIYALYSICVRYRLAEEYSDKYLPEFLNLKYDIKTPARLSQNRNREESNATLLIKKQVMGMITQFRIDYPDLNFI